MQSKTEWKKRILPLVLILAAAAVILLYGRFAVREEYAYQIYRASDSLFTDLLTDETPAETTFSADRDMDLSGVLVTFVNYGVADQQGEVVITAENLTTGQMLGQTRFPAGSILEWAWQENAFPKTRISAGDEICVTVTTEGFTEDNALSVVKAEDDTNLGLKIRTNRTDPVQKFQAATAIFLLILLALVYILFYLRKVRVERIFLVVFPCMVLVFSLLIPAQLGPDEGAHLNTVYKIAEKMEGWESSDPGLSVILHEEFENSLRVDDPSHPYYAAYYDYLRTRRTDNTLTEQEYWGKYENPAITYVPAAAGIVIGRHLGLSTAGIIMVGRFFCFIPVFLLLLYAIHRIPFGKELLFTISMLPVMLQESATINADGIDIALSFALIAAILSRLYGEKGKIRFLDYAVILLSTFLLAGGKFGALLPLSFLSIVLFLRWWKRRKEETVLEEKILGIGGLVWPLFCLFAGFLPSFGSTMNTMGQTIWTEHYQLSDILHDPLGTLFLLGSTIYEKADFYLFSMGGTNLGWMNILLPQFVVMIGLFLVLLTALPEKQEIGRIAVREKWIFFLVSFLVVAFAVGGMMIGWTIKGSSSIEGVQGRYFLPALPLFLFAVQNRHVFVEDGSAVRKHAVFASVFLQVIVVTALFVRMQ